MTIQKSDADKMVRALESVFISPNEIDRNGEPANIVDGLYAIANEITHSAKLLGNNDALTSMGGLEALGLVIKESNELIAGAIGDVACALQDLAEAIRERKS